MIQYKTLKSDKLVDLIHTFWHQVNLSEHFILISCSVRLNIWTSKSFRKTVSEILFLVIVHTKPLFQSNFRHFFYLSADFRLFWLRFLWQTYARFLNTWAHFEKICTIWIYIQCNRPPVGTNVAPFLNITPPRTAGTQPPPPPAPLI